MNEVKLPLANRESNLKDSFVKMMQEPESDLVYSRELKTSNKNDSANQISNEMTQVEANLENDVKEYTDTLTTWVYLDTIL